MENFYIIFKQNINKTYQQTLYQLFNNLRHLSREILVFWDFISISQK